MLSIRSIFGICCKLKTFSIFFRTLYSYFLERVSKFDVLVFGEREEAERKK